MAGLTFLGGPSVPNPIGTITQIINAKMPSAQSMHWSFEQQGGWFSAQRRYTNVLRVFTNSPYVGPIQVQQALLGQGCFHGATYRFPIKELNGDASTVTATEIDTGSFVQAVEIEQETEDAKQWLARIQYSSFDINHELGSSQVQNGSIDPLEMAPEVHWSSAKYEISNVLDVNGNPFLNTCGDPLENPPKTEESRQVLSFIRNEATYDDNWAQTYRDSVNSDTFLGFPPNQARCKDITGKRIHTADYGYYWQVSYEFEFRIGTTTVDVETTAGVFGQPVQSVTSTTGWWAEVLNAGLRQKLSGLGNPKQILIDGQLITSPVFLQQDGSYKPDGQPYFLQFVLYRSQTFANLGIPSDVLTQNQ